MADDFQYIKLPDGSFGKFAANAKDSDIHAQIAKDFPQQNSKTAPQGLVSSFVNATGVSGLLHAAAHPINTLTALPDAIKQGVQDSVNNVKQGLVDYKQGGLSQQTRRDFANAIPVVGPALKQAQAQYDSGDTAGGVGTLLGTAAGFVAPEAGLKIAGAGLRGAGKAVGLAATSADAAKLAATRALVPGTVGEVMNRALKPGVQYGADTDALFEKTLKPTLATGLPVNDVSSLTKAVDAAKEANAQGYADLTAPYRKPQGAGPYRPSAIDGTPIAQAQMRSIPTMDLVEKPDILSPGGQYTTPGIAGKTAQVAKNYQRTFDVPTMDDIRVDANGKLNAFYQKAGGDQFAALSNPETARIKAVGDATRTQLYNQLGTDAGIDPAQITENQLMYGRLSKLSDIAGKRDIVFGRADPVSLAEKVATSHGGPVATAFNFAKQKVFKGLTDSDALVRSAVDRYQNPLATPLPVGSGVIQQAIAPIGTAATLTGKVLKRYAGLARYAAVPYAGGTE